MSKTDLPADQQPIAASRKLTTVQQIVEWIDRDLAEHRSAHPGESNPFVNGAMTALKNLRSFIDAHCLPPSPVVGEFDAESFWDNNKRTFTGVNGGEYIDKEDFEKAIHLAVATSSPSPVGEARYNSGEIKAIYWAYTDYLKENYKSK